MELDARSTCIPELQIQLPTERELQLRQTTALQQSVLVRTNSLCPRIMGLPKKSPIQNITNRVTSFIFANIQGLKTRTNNKVQFINGLLTESNAVFGAFTETHAGELLDSEIWIPGYNLYMCDRKIRSHGGVGLYIREDLVCSELLNVTNEVVEVLGLKIEKINLVIILIYKPPDATAEEFTEQINKIENSLDNLENPIPDIIFLGDFKLPSLRWKIANNNIIPGNLSRPNQPQIRELLRFCDKFSLNQQISEPTRNNNILDLVFTNNEDIIRDNTISDTTYSDHKLIEVQTTINTQNRPKTLIKREGLFSKLNFNNKRIDWEIINRELTNIPWETVLSNTSPTEGIEKLTLEAYQVCLKHVPLRKARKRTQTTL
ncbi:uncharacterized protein [Procambarus clarkii]|uniref:uncharacterized protein n=1 Tax=Procambarus clarkii TaxID=6728 RepID=UPI003743BDC4